MSTFTLLLSLLSSICVSASVYSGWYWLLPIVERIWHKQLEGGIYRLTQIGYQEPKVRFALSLIESILIAVFIYLSVHYVGWFVGGLCLLIAFHARPILLEWVIRKRECLLRHQVHAFCADLKHLAHGGLTLSQALSDAAFRTPQPLGPFVRRIVVEQRRGRPLRDAIASVRSGLQLDAFSLLVTALNISQKRGSSLMESLVGVAETLENSGQVELQLDAKTAAGRTNVIMLSLMPVGFLGMFWLMCPSQFPLLFTTTLGQVLFCSVIGLTYAGASWAHRLTTPEF